MKHRYFLQVLTGSSLIGLAGCQRFQRSNQTTTEEHDKVMNIIPQVQKIADEWLLEAKVVNVYNWDTSFHDVQLLAYAADGAKIGETQVGDLVKPGGDEQIVETTCSEFPIIITATARETPCEDALLPINYWVGTDAQRTETVDDEEVLWKDTYRECGEDLPPKRVLEKFNRASGD